MTIKDAIQILSKKETFYSVLGKVVSVDTEKKTCVVQPVDDLPTILDVRVSSVESPTTGIIAIPSVDSFVIVGQTPNEQPHLVMFSEIESYQLIAGDTIKFNDGSFGGLVKVEDLTDKINALEDKVNDVITALKTHTHPGVQPGAGVTSPSTSFTSITNLSHTQVADLENDKILHG